MKITLISTVLNESANIGKFLDSILNQTQKPNEVIIIDGNSSDTTYEILENYSEKFKSQNIDYFTKVISGNRAVGRNKAIELSSHNFIVCSDAGCILDKDWIKNIIVPIKDNKADVVAGYYKGISNDLFQKCVVPYVLVMPDRINPNDFLPATRSMAFTKEIWKKAGKFQPEYSHNEDFVFARKLREIGARILFIRDAFVIWIPANTPSQAYKMFYRFAKGDIEAGILRPKVVLIIARYILGILLLLLAIINKDISLFIFLVALMILYVTWTIVKNYKYVNDYRAILILPVLQFISDVAVIIGSIKGLMVWGIKKTQ